MYYMNMYYMSVEYVALQHKINNTEKENKDL